MIPMWAWQGRKKVATITNKTTTTDTHTVKLQLSRTQPLSAVSHHKNPLRRSNTHS